MDNKGQAKMIIASISRKPKEESDESADTEKSGKEQAAKEIMQAIKDDDAASFASALENFYSMC